MVAGQFVTPQELLQPVFTVTKWLQLLLLGFNARTIRVAGYGELYMFINSVIDQIKDFKRVPAKQVVIQGSLVADVKFSLIQILNERIRETFKWFMVDKQASW